MVLIIFVFDIIFKDAEVNSNGLLYFGQQADLFCKKPQKHVLINK